MSARMTSLRPRCKLGRPPGAVTAHALHRKSKKPVSLDLCLATGVIASATMIGTFSAGLQALLPEPAHAAQTVEQLAASLPSPVPIGDLAQDTPFWENVARYGQYFFSVMLGTGYVMLKPFASLLKRPVTAVLLIAFVIGFVFFVKTTVSAMLGVNDLFEYDPLSQ